MNPQVIAFVLFALLGCMVFVWFALCKILFNRLEHAHPQKYEAMGRPSLVLRNNLANNWSFLKFLARREYVALNDASLTKLCKATLQHAPEGWPEAIGRHWLQAKRNIKGENWDAAAVMARSALQLALREQGATGRNLRSEIEDLATKGVLPSIMKEWAHEVRGLGNDSAHPVADQPATDPTDARDIVQFLDFFLEYSYSLPRKINEYRARKAKAET